MFFSQKRIFYAILLILSYLILECLAWFHLRSHFIFTASDLRRLYEEKMPTTYFKAQQNEQDFFHLIAHPYFGFVQTPGAISGINNYGFSDPKIFPWKKTGNQFVLGILGGEVAEDLGLYWQKNKQLWSSILSAFGQTHKELVLANLALPSGKEPQSFFTFSAFYHLLDAAIFVGGHNELFEEDMLAAPLEYPWNSSWLYAHRSAVGGRDFYLRLMKYTRWQGLLTKLPLDFPLLTYSGMYYLLWKNVLRNLQLAQSRLEKMAGPKWPGSFSASQLKAMKLEIWEKYLRKSHQLAQLRNITYHAFLAPNPYVPNAKIFASKERALVINAAEEKEKGQDFRLLIEMAQTWRRQGLPISDLTGIFTTVSETVFADDVSGLNERGTALLGQAIIEKLKNTAGEGPASLSSPKQTKGNRRVR